MEVEMEHLRQPAVSGTFYPSDPGELRDMIRGFLKDAKPTGARPKAIIAPHAGFIYSGPIAGSAYARLGLGRAAIRRVILLGPSHRVAFRGLAVSSAEGFATPLGTVPVDREGIKSILELPFVRTFDAAHESEHSLEVQIPFLQEILGSFTLVPIVVGDADPAEVDAVLERLWGGEETAIVISSDLSHYQGYATAKRLDQTTSAAIKALNPEAIGPESACGCLPVRGLLVAARHRGLNAEILDVRNSGDTAGDKTRVVGYGAYAFV